MPLRDISFATIAGAGPNGAIMHYRVSRATNRVLGRDGELFLVDSGGNTRTAPPTSPAPCRSASPTEEMRERYTLVLKGMIAHLAAAFPGRHARRRHRRNSPAPRCGRRGLDYAHGTGHGVGSYLSVHEGPQRIAKTGTEKLLAGMILSNEPGYYKEGHYGIRLENLILVTPDRRSLEGGDIAMHGFETLTLAPFDAADAARRPADPRRAALARRLPRPRARRDRPDARRRDARLAGGGGGAIAALTSGMMAKVVST
jgi:Xaa-Pro aminopeptidase